jgi:hypothetical protein
MGRIDPALPREVGPKSLAFAIGERRDEVAAARGAGWREPLGVAPRKDDGHWQSILLENMGTLGVVPLAIASGAGSGARNAIGTGVICGVIAGTVLAVLCVPLFFVLVPRLLRARRPGEQGAARSEGLLAPAGG